MTNAFEDFAEGNFREGLRKLKESECWQDENESLDGPFYLGFPGVSGWGEALLVASLLKRHAANFDKRIQVYCRQQVSSSLANDPAFCVEQVECFKEAQSKGARSPLAILRRALIGDLLDFPFQGIETGIARARSTPTRPMIGLAWASISGGTPIKEKSIPITDFLGIIGDIDAEIVSFQRELGVDDCEILQDRFSDSCSMLSADTLNSYDQANIVVEVLGLDCMVTISTTTAHIAACLGVPTVLLTARRLGPQWFWRAQLEHGKCFYPSVCIVMGCEDGDAWWKDRICFGQNALLEKLEN